MKLSALPPSLIILLLLSSTSCLRFVPTHSSSANQQHNQQDPTSITTPQVGSSADLFTALANNETQLQKLLQTRAELNAQGASSTYSFAPGDLLEFTVFKSPDLNSQVRVRPDGTVSLPLIGDITAQDRTEAEVLDEATTRLGKFVRNPRISLVVKEYEGSSVHVLGEVNKPGKVLLQKEATDLLEVLSSAGGASLRAATFLYLVPAQSPQPSMEPTDSVEKSRLSPPTPNKADESIEIALARLVGGANTRPLQIPIIPGDTIIVPRAGSVQINGEVIRPGVYPLTSQTSLLGAIAAAGGLTYSANIQSLELIRTVGPQQRASATFNLEEVALKGGRDVILRGGDLIIVPSEGGRFFTRQVVDAINQSVGVNIFANSVDNP